MDPRPVSLAVFLAAVGAAGCSMTTSPSSSTSSSGSSSSPPPAAIRSSFDTDDEGWMLQAFNSDANDYTVPTSGAQAPTWQPSGGDPGGVVMRNETFFGYADYFQAPAKFHGDVSAYYGGSLAWELRAGDVAAPFTAPLVLLQGGGTYLRYDASQYATTSWSSFRVPLDASAGGWTVVAGGAPVSEDVLRAALASVTGLWIRGEFSSDVDQSWLDEVVVSR